MAISMIPALAILCGAMQEPIKLKDRKERPKLIHRVNPIYPPQALKSGIQGRIAISAVTDENGDVVKATVIPGLVRLPLLEASALEAIRQWKYEPFLQDGKPVAVEFTVIANFRLNGDKKPATNPISEGERPKLVQRLAPQYPREALKKQIQGEVRLNVHIDETGTVIAVAPVKDGEADPLLATAAAAAVAQWRYEPYLEDGKPRAVDFEVTVTFKLN